MVVCSRCPQRDRHIYASSSSSSFANLSSSSSNNCPIFPTSVGFNLLSLSPSAWRKNFFKLSLILVCSSSSLAECSDKICTALFESRPSMSSFISTYPSLSTSNFSIAAFTSSSSSSLPQAESQQNAATMKRRNNQGSGTGM